MKLFSSTNSLLRPNQRGLSNDLVIVGMLWGIFAVVCVILAQVFIAAF